MKKQSEKGDSVVLEILKQLREEHRAAARILNALERQLGAFNKAEQRPDYEIILAIANYFVGFPEQVHHPKEDLIYDKLIARQPGIEDDLIDLGVEHGRLSECARRFREVVNYVLEEAEISRALFNEIARGFISDQRQHMSIEEERFFPQALEILTDQDWKEIEDRSACGKEPIFAGGDHHTYAELRDNILKWDREVRSG